MDKNRPVTVKSLISYGVGDIYGGGSFLIISLLFMYFLTDTVGLAPALAGLVMLPGKVWDAISDPMMGYLSDNTRTRFGRRRVYFLAGILPVALTFMAMWVTVRSDNSCVSFAYYATAFIFFRTAFTMVMVPYSALNAEMSVDYRSRMRLSGARMIFSQASSLVCAVLPKMLMGRYYAGNPEQGYLVMGAVFGSFFALPWILVFLGTWEITEADREVHATTKGFFRDLAGMLVNRSFRIHMGMYISSYAAMDVLMAVFIYYLTYYMGSEGLFPMCVGAMLLAQVIMLPFYVYVANKRGKGFAYILGLVIWAAGLVFTLGFNPGTPTVVLMAVSALMGAGLSAGTMIPWAILPSVTDVDEMITARKRAGAYAGAMTFIRKIVNAMTIFLFGLVLDGIGYLRPVMTTVEGITRPVNQVQGETTIFWLKTIFFLLPFLLIVIGIVVALRFRITPETHGILVAEIARLRGGGSMSDVTPEARKVCEELTGLPYGELFRKEQR